MIFICLGLLMLYGFVWLIRLAWFRPLNIEHFFERMLYAQAEMDPEAFVYLPSSQLDNFSRFRVELTERSRARYLKAAQQATDQLETLNGYNFAQLSAANQRATQVIRHQLELQIQAADFADYHHLIQSFSAESDPIFFLTLVHPVHSKEQAKSYVSKIKKLKLSYRQIIQGLTACEAVALFPPKILIEQQLIRLGQYVALPPAKHPLYTTFADKVVRIPRMEITQYDQLEYLRSIEASIQQDVYPAFEEMITYLEQLLRKAREEEGIWALSRGQAFYKHLILKHNISPYKPEEIHQQGLEIVNQTQRQIQELLMSNDLQETDWQQVLTELSPQDEPSNRDSLKADYLKKYAAELSDAAQKVEGLFGTQISRHISLWEMPIASPSIESFYIPPPLEAKGNARLYLNFSGQRLPLFSGLKSDVYRHLIPGRHLLSQLCLQQDSVPLMVKLLPKEAFMAGWELYAQQLAYEYSFHGEMKAHLAYLQNQLLQAALLVIDSGIHHKRWSKEQAEEYLQLQAILSPKEAEIWTLRVIADAGKFSAPILSFQEIIKLREKAQQYFGQNFYITDFHLWLVKQLGIPFFLIRENAEGYLK